MKVIKALTVWQPYASLIALGLKTEEIRSWWTAYRGPLAIQAGQQISRAFYGNEEIYQALCGIYPTHLNLPRGRVLCLVDLRDIRNSMQLPPDLPEVIKGFTRRHLEYRAWKIPLLKVLEEPVPAVGRQGLWDWEPPKTLEI